MSMRMNKRVRCASVWVLSIFAALFMSSVAFAADYQFDGVEETGYYPSTEYEETYGSRYEYGGMNEIEMVAAFASPYGVTSGIAIGAAERVIHAELNSSSGFYGVQLGGEPSPSSHFSVTYEENSPYIYQPSAYTPAAGMELADGSLGTVQIPALNLEVKVWEGETTESMAKGLGHYSSSSGWDGNVCVCGHNRGAKCAIGPIKDLEIGDTITYTTVFGTRTYSVSFVGVISNTDWSHLQSTADNRITLTTCLANHPEYRVCVQAVEVS